MERYSVSLRIKSESEKVRTRKNYLFGYFSRSDCSVLEYQKEGSCVLYYKRSLDYLQKICHNIKYLPLTVTQIILGCFFLLCINYTHAKNERQDLMAKIYKIQVPKIYNDRNGFIIKRRKRKYFSRSYFHIKYFLTH